MKKVTKIAQNTTDLTEYTKLRCYTYCRISTDSDEQLESLDAQIKHYESYVNANPEWSSPGSIMMRASPEQKEKYLNCSE